MFDHLHQIDADAVLKPFNLTYLGLVLLQDEASTSRVNQGSHKQKSTVPQNR